MLCCGLLGSATALGQDMLLQLAAARVLTLLLDPTSWGCHASGTQLRYILPCDALAEDHWACDQCKSSLGQHMTAGRYDKKNTVNMYKLVHICNHECSGG